MNVSFLNTYYQCLMDQVHQLLVIKDTSLMGSDSTQEKEKKGKKTQNSRVIVTVGVSSFASARDTNLIFGHVSYYGVLTDIVELHYLSGNRVILFKCDMWDEINIGKGIKKDEYGFTCLNFERTICTNEPFVLASQTKQVVFVQNSNEEN